MLSDDSFLGKGWSFPPSFSRGGREVRTVSGSDDIRQSLEILLATRRGERILQESFGCNLDDQLFEEVDRSLLTTTSRRIADAIVDHEPRIELERVDIEPVEGERGLLRIQIAYSIRGTNSRFNLVFPYYLDEASTPGGRG